MGTKHDVSSLSKKNDVSYRIHSHNRGQHCERRGKPVGSEHRAAPRIPVGHSGSGSHGERAARVRVWAMDSRSGSVCVR